MKNDKFHEYFPIWHNFDRRDRQDGKLSHICQYYRGSHRGIIANELIKIGSNSYEKVKTLKYSDCLLTNQNSIKCRVEAGNS